MTIVVFRKKIWDYYRRAGRTALPWRQTRDPYAIFISEVMLQQTQVARVEEYYAVFLKKFPNFGALARAKTSAVLAVWQGLGYNRRALFLQRAAEIVVKKYGGFLPRDRAALESLPGIGPGTSGSLMAFAFNDPAVFIETNIRRVFIHFFFARGARVTDAALIRYIEKSVDQKNAREWYWALMDFGAAMPRAENPNHRSAHYKKQAAFAGSDRQLRGKILRSVLSADGGKIKSIALMRAVAAPQERFTHVLGGLKKEGFVMQKKNYIYIQSL